MHDIHICVDKRRRRIFFKWNRRVTPGGIIWVTFLGVDFHPIWEAFWTPFGSVWEPFWMPEGIKKRGQIRKDFAHAFGGVKGALVEAFGGPWRLWRLKKLTGKWKKRRPGGPCLSAAPLAGAGRD